MSLKGYWSHFSLKLDGKCNDALGWIEEIVRFFSFFLILFPISIILLRVLARVENNCFFLFVFFLFMPPFWVFFFLVVLCHKYTRRFQSSSHSCAEAKKKVPYYFKMFHLISHVCWSTSTGIFCVEEITFFFLLCQLFKPRKREKCFWRHSNEE